MNSTDRRYQHIFWRAAPSDRLQEYTLNTVTYDVISAPYLAIQVLRDIAEQQGDRFSAVEDALLLLTYMDDICSGGDTVEEALILQYDLIQSLSTFGFDLKNGLVIGSSCYRE